MTPGWFLKRREELTEIAENKSNELLARVDAYLELAQLCQQDTRMSAVYVREARDLIFIEADNARKRD